MTIYFARAGSDGPIKIGLTSGKSAKERLRGLQVGCPWPLNLVGEIEGGRERETLLHEVLSPHRMSGEWFEPNSQVLRTIKAVLAGTFKWPALTKVDPVPVYKRRSSPIDEVLQNLGGVKAVAELTGRTIPAVRMWRYKLNKFPASTFALMRRKLAEVGHKADPDMWGMIPIKPDSSLGGRPCNRLGSAGKRARALRLPVQANGAAHGH